MCFGDTTQCTTDNCFLPCLLNPASDGCRGECTTRWFSSYYAGAPHVSSLVIHRTVVALSSVLDCSAQFCRADLIVCTGLPGK